MKSALIAAALSLAFVCAADAAIPYERAVSAPLYGVPPGGRSAAVAASDGEAALLVWNDYGRGAIYASRLGADGVVTGVFARIEAQDVIGGPFVFWSGNAYLLLWSERDGLHAAQLDSSGSVIAAPHLAAPDVVQPYSAASNGTRVVMNYNNRLAIFDLAGRLLESFPMFAETVASNGHGFLVSYRSPADDLYVMALDAAGHPVGLSQYVASNIARAVPASNGDEYLLVIDDIFGNAPLLARFAADGSRLPTPAFPLPPGYSISLSWTGSDYLYTWSAFNPVRISALRFDAVSGAQRGAAAVLVDDAAPHAVAWIGGGTFVLTWVNFAGAIQAEVVEPVSLTHGTAVLVSVSAAEQLAPHIAWSGRNYLVVWQERSAMYAMRMDDLGRTLDTAAIAVASYAANPNVVFDGANFVVSWMGGTTLWLNRIDPDSGALLDGAGSIAAQSLGMYDIASAGAGGTLLAFESTEHRLDRRLRVLRVDRALQPSGAPLAITPPGMLAHNPSIAWSGTQWLVAFEEEVPVSAPFETPADWNRADIRAVRITQSMTPLDTEPMSLAVSDDTGPRHRTPHAASSGDDYLVAWSYGFISGAHDVLARRVRPNGTLGATMDVTAGQATSAISTPAGYAIGIATATDDAIGATLDGFFKISVTSDLERSVALVYANGRVTGAYTRVATEALYGNVSRVFVRDARPWHGRAAGH
ncbi:MAG TPA: hypothetical protein VG323_00505 [Thermoanaerobaculia bacterium]|nr:hypothetical protein [Thermoanaerobaculia bacterium]